MDGRWKLALTLGFLSVATLPPAVRAETSEWKNPWSHVKSRKAKDTKTPRAPAPPAEHSVVLIMLDGTAFATFESLYEAGRLPRMASLVKAKNGRLFRSVTSFPSATAPSLPELLVGRYADRTNTDFLRHVQEFFRDTGKIKRYAFDHRSWDSTDDDLFSQAKAAGKQTYAYAESEYESADKNKFEPFFYQMEFLTGYSKLPTVNYDRQVFDSLLEDLAARPTLPELTFLELDLVDIAGHSYGTTDPHYAKAFEEEDQDIGRLVDALASRPHPSGGTLLDHTDLYVFGDHGMANTEHNMVIGDELTRLGLKTSDGSDFPALMEASVNAKWYDEYDAIVLAVGSNAADVHVRGKVAWNARLPWTDRPSYAQLRKYPLSKMDGTMDLLAFFQGYPGVDHVLVPDGPGRVRILASGGSEALVEAESKKQDASAGTRRRYAYTVVRLDREGRDPLGYLRDHRARELVTLAESDAARFFDEDEWMKATASTNYPFAPALLPKAFIDEPTTPDFTVDLQDGFSCMNVMNGDHASLSAANTTSFLIAAGPDLSMFPVEGRSTVRLIDVHENVRQALGLPADPLTDSRGLGYGPEALPEDRPKK